jgi:opacity protein-like surface antigen
MRKVLIALAAAGSALALASPASAQYYPQPQQPYGYGGQAYGYNGYGQNGYGHNGYGYNGFGQVQQLQQRIDALQNRIRWMDRANVIRDHSADRLKEEARDLEKRLRKSSRYGLNPYELNSIQARLARLEQRVQYASARFGHGGYGHNGYNNGGYYGDRDRDGRDDRYEEDQGRDRDD